MSEPQASRSGRGQVDDRAEWLDRAERWGVFVPIGLVASVARSVPGSVDEVAERGRAEVLHLVERVEMKVRTARVVGQFAAPRVRRVITDRVDRQRADRRAAARRHAAAQETATDDERRTASEPPPATGTADTPAGPGPRATRPPRQPRSPRPPVPETGHDPTEPVSETATPETAAPETVAPETVAPAAAELPIDGYDQLGASQIVAHLDGLGPAELDAVRRYELAGRQRRTILTRIQQLASDR
jgi:hypothetical protein